MFHPDRVCTQTPRRGICVGEYDCVRPATHVATHTSWSIAGYFQTHVLPFTHSSVAVPELTVKQRTAWHGGHRDAYSHSAADRDRSGAGRPCRAGGAYSEVGEAIGGRRRILALRLRPTACPGQTRTGDLALSDD